MILLDDVYVYLNDNMPNGAKEIVCPNIDGTYTVLINGDLEKEDQVSAFWHAIRHIKHNDFERVETSGVQAIEAEAHSR